jgi:hypothetical protein
LVWARLWHAPIPDVNAVGRNPFQSGVAAGNGATGPMIALDVALPHLLGINTSLPGNHPGDVR